MFLKRCYRFTLFALTVAFLLLGTVNTAEKPGNFAVPYNLFGTVVRPHTFYSYSSAGGLAAAGSLFRTVHNIEAAALSEEMATAPSAGENQPEGGLYLYTEALFNELDEKEIAAEKYFRLVDSEGRHITTTGRRIRPGDRYLDEKNRLYEVYRVRDYTAEARYIRTEELNSPGLEKRIISPVMLKKLKPVANDEEEWPRKLVAIYHTHNAESYVPSDGKESIFGRGGIHDVGEAFKEALESKGVNVLYSENMHLPHDRGAYRRSRNTALELLHENPDAIFDLHRDAAPVDAYAAQVEEDWVTQIQFVVGRQNPSYSVTRRFAYDLKGLADKVYPGLVKGVFMGWGNYNQDLTPLNLLLEVGAHLNSKEAAENGIALFADVVALYFYGISTEDEERGGLLPRADDPDAAGGAIFATIAIFLLLVAAALGGFYFMNNPFAWNRFKEKARYYFGANGLVWREGFQNLNLLIKTAASWTRKFFVYLILLLQLLPSLFRELRRKLIRLFFGK